ncbi:MAG: TonB family protein [Chitinophagales bacterium]|nr:TonB family protein [Chitinophagales bacterium]
MFPHNDVFSSGWCSIVFANRNQAYGAYQLRQISERSLIVAMLISTFLLSGFTGAVLYAYNKPVEAAPHIVEIYPDLGTIVEVPKNPTPEPPAASRPAAPTAPSSQTNPNTLSIPLIVADSTAIDQLPTQNPDEQPHVEPIGVPGGTGTSLTNTTGTGTGTEPTTPTNTNDIHNWVQVMPEFPGGQQAMMKFIASNMEYPAIPLENEVEETIYVNFVVNEHGSVVNSKITKGRDKYLCQEALRVINSMPAWKPGMHNGQKVKVQFTLPIKFSIK